MEHKAPGDLTPTNITTPSADKFLSELAAELALGPDGNNNNEFLPPKGGKNEVSGEKGVAPGAPDWEALKLKYRELNKVSFDVAIASAWSVDTAHALLAVVYDKGSFSDHLDFKEPSGSKETWRRKLTQTRARAVADATALSEKNSWLTRAAYFNSFFTHLETWLRARMAVDMAYAAPPLRGLETPDRSIEIEREAKLHGVNLRRNPTGRFILQDEDGRSYKA